MATSYSAFFYGTLLHPLVLKRVIGNDGLHLSLCPAVLLEHTRHRVKDCDYPAVIPYSASRSLFDRELSREERSVRGNLVVGLSKADIELLDVFEGDEYKRDKVMVYPLAPLETFDQNPLSTITTHPEPLPAQDDLAESTEAFAYIWVENTRFLVPELWSYATFIRDNAWKWVGESANKEEFTEVDLRRAANEAAAKTAAAALQDAVLN